MHGRAARFVRRITPGLLALALCAAGDADAQTRTRHFPHPPPVVDAPARPQIDLVFVLDGTGSMGDEIGPVRDQIWSIANRIASGNPRPALRVGLVVYRDRNDREHTRMLPLTRDLDEVHAELMRTDAYGGGDYPEDVYAGLSLALHEMDWAPRAARMVFLVGDAPPQEYGDHDGEGLVRYARTHQIEVSTIECSGMSAMGSALWSSIATRTNGLAEVLTYAQDQQMADGSSRTILRRGRDTYVSTRALSAEERAQDARTLASRGVVRAARGDELAGAGTDEGMALGGLGSSRGGGGRGRAVAAAPARPMAAPTNNIDSVIARRVRSRATSMGVAY
ncbi:MAG: vWA domain-containing protein [Polyangiales bacterium]